MQVPVDVAPEVVAVLQNRVAVRVEAGVLVAELQPGGQRVVFRRIHDGCGQLLTGSGDNAIVTEG
jgi:hypothetical protein